MTEQEQKRRERELGPVMAAIDSGSETGDKPRFLVSVYAYTGDRIGISGPISIAEGEAYSIIDILSGQDDRYWDLSREQIHGLVALVDAERERQKEGSS